MPHVFFERLESRRSTQTLYTGYTNYFSPGFQAYYGIDTTTTTNWITPDPGPRLLYGVFQPPQDTSKIYYNPFTNPFSWNYGGYDPYSYWNNPFNNISPYGNSWLNQGIFGGFGSPYSPYGNIFGNIFNNIFGNIFGNPFGGWFGLQPTPVFPYQNNYYNPGNSFPGEIRALYAVSIGPSSTSVSYTPPGSTVTALYGITWPGF